MTTKIADGLYTLVYSTGDYRTVRVKTQPEGKWAAGKTILKLKQGHDFYGCGFLRDDNRVAFWQKFKDQNAPKRLELIQKAVDRIAADPEAAGMAFALKENRCRKCNAELSVPASLHRGMGPECYRKDIKKEDNRQAYLWRAGQKQPQPPLPNLRWGTAYDHAGTKTTVSATAPASGSPGPVEDEDLQLKNQYATWEREQESRAMMRDPDYYDPDASFWTEPCGICGRPRNECCC